MGQETSSMSGERATTAEEFVQAFTGQQGGGAQSELTDIDVIPGVTQFTKEQALKLDVFVGERIKQLRIQLRKLSQDNNKGFLAQFQGITAGQSNEASASKARGNENLNRYANIVAYDHTRVQVTRNQFNLNNDYVNANWIAGADGPKHYIASQGPVPDSFPAFWQMVWEYNVGVIVMVTNEVENGRLKCHRYWPEPIQGSADSICCGAYVITFKGHEVYPTHVVRTFSIEETASKAKREVIQFAYTGWPDHGVPATTKEMIDFRHRVKEEHLKRKGPLLTHCSAGVGRTGTFIGIDRYLDNILQLKEIPVLSLVEDMRNSRNFMVQSPIQFVFLYVACLDAMERLRKTTRKVLDFMGMTEEERHAAELKEATAALKKGEEVISTWKLRQGRKSTRASEVFNHAEAPVKETRDKDDLNALGAQKLTERIESLKETQRKWQSEFDKASSNWALERGENGEIYNVEETMEPLESRLRSFADAQKAFAVRSGQDADLVALRDQLATVHDRLKSLHRFVFDEDSWRKKGHGFRGKEVEPPLRSHTVEMLGTLQNRLEMLAEDTMFAREGTTHYRYDGPSTFVEEVQQQRTTQEEVMLSKMKRQQEEAERLQKDQEYRERIERERREKEEATRKDKEHREQVKEMFNRVPEVPLTDKLDPARVREEKRRLAEIELKKKQEEERKLAEEERKKQEKLEAEQAKKTKAKKKASRFLGRLRK